MVAAAWLLLLILLPMPLRAQPAPAPTVSLLSFAPGEIYWQRFGHNAILVRDPASGEPRVYNYGVFDFEQKNFFLNFARGRMLYRLDVAPLNWTLRQYAAERRWAVEQQLALAPEQARELAAFLAWNALPENAEYRYDYFTANCSTRVRDALDGALNGALRAQLQQRPGEGSYRSEVLRLMSPLPLLAAGMDLGMGPRVDLPIDQWQEGFIPMRLMASVRAVRVEDGSGGTRPLVAAEQRLLDIDGVGELAPHAPSTLGYLLVGLALAVVLVLPGRLGRPRLQAALVNGYVLLCGVGGLVLLLGWLATEHWVMWGNYNLLLLNPLWLLLPVLVSRRAGRALTVLLGAGALLALPAAIAGVQENLHWVLLFLPAHAAALAVLARRV